MKNKNNYLLLTEEQTIEALNCCLLNSDEACDKCPIEAGVKDDCVCFNHIVFNALNLINELKADNEELKHKLNK